MKWEFWPWRPYLWILLPPWTRLSPPIPPPMWIPQPGGFSRPRDQPRITWTFMEQTCTCCSRRDGWGGCTEAFIAGLNIVGVRHLWFLIHIYVLHFNLFLPVDNKVIQRMKFWQFLLSNVNHMTFFSFLDSYIFGICLYIYIQQCIMVNGIGWYLCKMGSTSHSCTILAYQNGMKLFRQMQTSNL